MLDAWEKLIGGEGETVCVRGGGTRNDGLE